MKSRLIQILKIIVPIGLGVYLVFHIYNQLSPDERKSLFDSIRTADYLFVALSFLMGLMSHAIRGHRWGYQLEAMGYQTREPNNFMAVMVGYLVNMLLPRVGEVSRAAAITNYESVPFQKSFGSILSERAVDFIILCLIACITIFLQYDFLQAFLAEIGDAIQVKAGSGLLWLAGGAFLVLILSAIWAFRRFSQLPIVEKILEFVRGLLEGIRSILRMKKRFKYLLATIAIWVLYVGMYWICFYSLSETSHLGADAVFAGFVLGSVAIVLVPGGIGAYPVAVMQILALYGTAEPIGFALGWIIWFSQTAMILIVGGISALYIPIYNRKIQNASPELSKRQNAHP